MNIRNIKLNHIQFGQKIAMQIIDRLTSALAPLLLLAALSMSANGQITLANSDSLLIPNSPEQTFTFPSFSPARGDKLIVTVSAEGRDVGGIQREVTDVTFGGVALTLAVGFTEGNAQHTSIWYLDAPDDTPSDLVVTWNGLTNGCGIGAFSLIGANVGAPDVSLGQSGQTATIEATEPNTFVITSFVANNGSVPTLDPPYTLLAAGNVGSALAAFGHTNVAAIDDTTPIFTASGNRPAIAVVGIVPSPPDSDPNLNVAPAAVFGDFTENGSGFVIPSETIFVTNNATLDLEISGLSVVGPDAASFSFPAQTLPITLGAGEELEIDITIDTFRDGLGLGGTFSADLQITSNDPNQPVTLVALSSFTVTDPEIDLPDNAPIFGSIIAETAPSSITRSVSIGNLGLDEDLLVTTNITGPDAASFMVTTPAPTVAPSENASIDVQLTPAGATSFTATLEINSNDPDLPTILISLNTEILVNPLQIILVSQDADVDETIEFLQQNTMVEAVTSGTFANMTLAANQDELTLLNNADLVLFDRRVQSPPYIGQSVAFWDSVTTTIIQTSAYLARGDRWAMVDGNVINDSVMTGTNQGTESTVPSAIASAILGLAEGSHDLIADRNASTGFFISTQNIGGGFLLTSALDNTATQSAFWPAGSTNFGGVTYPGPRYFFGLDSNGAPAPINQLLTSSGESALLSLIATVIPLRVPLADFEVTQIIRNPDNTITLSWASSAAATYTIRYATDLSQPISSWAIDTADIEGAEATTTATTDTAFGQTRVFFAVEEQ